MVARGVAGGGAVVGGTLHCSAAGIVLNCLLCRNKQNRQIEKLKFNSHQNFFRMLTWQCQMPVLQCGIAQQTFSL